MIDGFSHTHFMIQKKKVEVLEGEIDQEMLSFYPENPRIYSIVCSAGETPTQDKIFEILSKMDHVKRLYQSIKLNGGLTDPVIVKKDTLEVLEGNSRLAAYRMLSQKDPISWSKILVRVLPSDISDSQIFSLLGEYHVNGKKDWSPFEVASYVYRRHVKHAVPKSQIATELSKSSKAITHLINVVQFMMDKGEENPNRWSYYDEYLKSRKLSSVRKEYPELDAIVVAQIQDGRIAKAADIRDKLPVIATSNSKNLKKYVQGERDFSQAFDSAQAQGADAVFYCKLKRTRDVFADTSIDEELSGMSLEVLRKCKFELHKLEMRLSQLREKVERLV
jgi:hypothetical protein